MTTLKGILESRGITQKEFAKTLGIERNTLNNYVNNKRQMNYETLHMVSKALECSIDELLEDVEVSTEA